MTKPEFISAEIGTRVTAHALHLGDRINTMGFEDEALSAVPLAVRVGNAGIAVPTGLIRLSSNFNGRGAPYTNWSLPGYCCW